MSYLYVSFKDNKPVSCNVSEFGVDKIEEIFPKMAKSEDFYTNIDSFICAESQDGNLLNGICGKFGCWTKHERLNDTLDALFTLLKPVKYFLRWLGKEGDILELFYVNEKGLLSREKEIIVRRFVHPYITKETIDREKVEVECGPLGGTSKPPYYSFEPVYGYALHEDPNHLVALGGYYDGRYYDYEQDRAIFIRKTQTSEC